MIIPKETPWAVLLCKFSPDLSAGNPMGYSAMGTRVVFRGQGNEICEMHLGTSSSSSWGMANLTASAAGAPAAAGDPRGYLSNANTLRVDYRGQDGHIHEIYIAGNGQWAYFPLSAATGAPVAAGDPMGYMSSNAARVVYRGQDNHIHELYLTDQWYWADLSGGAGAPDAAGDPIGYMSSNAARVVYRGQDNHIHELYLTDQWYWADLSGGAGAPDAAGDPMGYMSSNAARVVYRGQDNHIHELYLTDQWYWADLSGGAGAPDAAGDPIGYMSSNAARVVYHGQDNHIHELYLTDQWYWADLSGGAGAPDAAGDSMGYMSSNAARVVYRGQDNHIHEIAIDPASGNWGHFDMSAGPAAAEPFPRWFYENLFTTSGIGFNNMIDFFRLFSHGNVDLTKSQVFGWLTLTQSRCDYTGSGFDHAGRGALINWARDAASAAGVDLSPFFGVVVCMNVPTDLFGVLGGKAMVCDNGSMMPSLLGQEMGHGYGLDHSRADGSAADYQDPWDVMSTASWPKFMVSDPNFTKIGPSLNAANMDSQGWLDPSRVWSTPGYFDEIVQLRPHHRRDLPGFLVARVGQFCVEFRMKEGWDAAIPKSAVLIHRFEDNHSYLMKGISGPADLTEDKVFRGGDHSNPLQLAILRVEVVKIDIAARQATVRLSSRPGAILAAGDPMGYMSSNAARVVYRGQDNHIHELYLTDQWYWADLSGGAGAPDAAGDSMGYMSSNAARVVYRGQDNHIHELYLTDQWYWADLSGGAGAPDAAGDSMGYMSSNAARVVYRGQDNHIHELYLTDQWYWADLSGGAGAPDAAGDPMGYMSSNAARVVYRGQDNHIHELYLTDQWYWADLSGGAGAPDAAGDPMGYMSSNAARVVYHGQDNHIHELYLTDQWYHFDMSDGANP